MNPANALSQLSPGMAECHARLMAVAKHGTTEAFSATLAGVLQRAELSISNAYDAGAKSSKDAAAVPSGATSEIAKAFREYLAVHPSIKLGGHEMDAVARELALIAVPAVVWADALRDAENLLRRDAESLREGHTSHRDREDWTGEDDAKAGYDEYIRAADALAALAGAASSGKAPAHLVTVEQVEDAIGLQSTAWDTIGAEKIVEAVLRLANGQAPAPAGAFGHTIDCIGLALDLESAAKKATSQTTQRAMEAAAHGLRLLATPTPQAAQRAPAVENELWRKRLLREDIAWLEMFVPNTRERSHIIDVLRGAMDGQAPAAGAVAGPDDDIDAVALARYKVVPSHDSMFHRFAVVAGDGKQQLYLGRETECQNMARKFAGAFLDGAFHQSQIAAAPTPAAQQGDAADLDTWQCERCHGKGWHWQSEAVNHGKEIGIENVDLKTHCDACEGAGWCGPDAERAALAQKKATP